MQSCQHHFNVSLALERLQVQRDVHILHLIREDVWMPHLLSRFYLQELPALGEHPPALPGSQAITNELIEVQLHALISCTTMS